jgi:hypothetical protein
MYELQIKRMTDNMFRLHPGRRQETGKGWQMIGKGQIVAREKWS